jgi:hypothetical protein
MKTRFFKLGLQLILLVSVLNFGACKKKAKVDQPEEQVSTTKSSGSFSSPEIGWTITVPENWEIIEQDELEGEAEIGDNMINGEAVPEGSPLNHVVSFRRDEFNFLSATTQAFEEAYPGEYKDNNGLINQLIYNTFTSQGIKVETTLDSTTIGDKKFTIYSNKIYDADGKVFLTQELYSCLINGYDFAVNLAFNNETYKAEMLKALQESNFKKL